MFRSNGFSTKILLLAMCVILSLASKNKYCNVCDNHTMCVYHGLGEKCKDPGGSGVTKKEIEYILKTHNSFRSQVALGLERRGNGGHQPKSANMLKLYWDDSLAEVAQRWADQCNFGHDSCRDDPRWHVGQNVFWKHKYSNHKVNWTEAMFGWYNEVDLFDPESIKTFGYDGVTGHYTQLMWHDTQYVGCGRRDYGNSKFYVCNYGPAGNWVNEPVYEEGEPCSKCPSNTICSEGLCAKEEKKQEKDGDVSYDFDNGNTDYMLNSEAELEVLFQDLNTIHLDAEILAEVENVKRQIISLIERAIEKTKLQNQLK